jgi:hypothetical protein
VEKAKSTLLDGTAVELEVPVSVKDGQDIEVARVQFVVAIKPKRR